VDEIGSVDEDDIRTGVTDNREISC
jgi:hypothetical protein